MEVADCGAACLAMALAYHGRQVRLEELRQTISTSRDGVDARTLIEAARAYGLKASGVAADLADLAHVSAASILHWDFTHFVVFERANRAGVHIVDPATGRRRVSWKEFGRFYTGVAIALEPGEDFQRGKLKAQGTLRYLRPLLAQSRTLARVLISSVLLRLLALALPVLTGLVVDEIVPQDNWHMLAVVGAAMAGMAGYYLLSSFLRAHLLLQLRTHLDLRLTTDFVEHLVALPYTFFLGRSAGDLMMRLESNSVVRETLTTGTLSTLLDGTLASLYLVLLAALSPVMAVLVLGLGLVQVMTLLLSWRRTQHLVSENLRAQAKSQSYTYELLAGIETLKAAGAEQSAAEHWKKLFADQINLELARGRLSAGVQSVLDGLSTGSPLAILLVGATQVLAGHMSLGAMLGAAALAGGFLQPLTSMVTAGLNMQLLRSYMERINDVLDMPREQQGRHVVPAPRLSGQARAEHVSFAYGSHAPPVVRDVSLEITPGQQIGIVGPSGSGKTTLAHLLLGLYHPTEGRITFDALDLDDLEVTSLRRQFGIVTQRPYLFGSTIHSNITNADPAVSLDAVIQAATLACIHDTIAAMPLGYQTPLADGGASLSGGEQQRVALARALVRTPAILVLDEATSDLDTVTERKVYDNLNTLGCTTVIIAHRLSTVTRADLILVMDQGRIIDQGTHEQLMASPGMYRRLVGAQTVAAGQRLLNGTRSTGRIGRSDSDQRPLRAAVAGDNQVTGEAGEHADRTVHGPRDLA